MIAPSHQFVNYNDRLLRILRYYPDYRVRNADEIKKWLRADIAIRKEGITYFCEEIQEAEIVPEIVDDKPIKKSTYKIKKK